MAEYIDREEVIERINKLFTKNGDGLVATNDYNSGINAAKVEIFHCSVFTDVQPVSAIKELQEHIKQRILETAFNNSGIYREVAEDIADRIDIWVDEFRRAENDT